MPNANGVAQWLADAGGLPWGYRPPRIGNPKAGFIGAEPRMIATTYGVVPLFGWFPR